MNTFLVLSVDQKWPKMIHYWDTLKNKQIIVVNITNGKYD